MERIDVRQVGFGNNRNRVCPGIYESSPVQRGEGDQGLKSLRFEGSYGGGKLSSGKELHRKSPARAGARGLLFDLFSGPQKTHRSQANSKFEAYQQVFPQKAFQDGISQISKGGSESGRLAGGHRPVRRVHAHSSKKITQKVSEIQNKRSGLSIQSPSFRVSHGAQSIHKGFGPDSGILQEARGAPLPVFGRLACKGSSGECMYAVGNISDSDPSEIGLVDKFPKVPFSSVPKKTVHWGSISDGPEYNLSSRRQDRFHFSVHKTNSGITENFCQTPPQTSGPHGSDHRGGSVCEITNETYPIIPSVSLEAKLYGAGYGNSGIGRINPTSAMVDKQGESVLGSPSGGEGTGYCTYDRCQRRRLGSPSVTIPNSRDVDLYGASVAHQQKRNGGNLQSVGEIPILSNEQNCVTQMRQYDHGHIHQQTGGDKISVSLHASLENVAVCEIPQYLNEGSSSSREAKLHGRQAEQSFCKSLRMDVEKRGGETGFPTAGTTSDRPICDERKSSALSFLLKSPRRCGVPPRRSGSVVGRNLGVCIPSDSIDPVSDTEGEEVKVPFNTDSPEMASKGVLPRTSRVTDGGPTGTPSDTGPVISGQGQTVAPTAGGVLHDGLEAERQYLRQEGIPEDAINAIQNSIRPSTREQYSRYWKTYCSWCCGRGYDPYSASVSMIIAFLQSLYNKGLKHGSLMVYRSAIARFHRGINGKPVSHNVTLSKFMRGIFNMNPPKKSLLPTWNLNVVLSMLQKAPYEPLSEASLRAITLKCVFLVAITTAKRCSEIQALGRDPEYLRLEKRGYRLRTVQGFLSKTAVPGHLGNDIFVPSYSKFNKLLCAKRALKYYLKATENCKNHEGHLFVAFGSKVRGNPVSRKTIASWIVQVIRGAYESKGLVPPKCRAHSTRAMSTSWAAFQGVSFSDILRAADWRCNRTFAKHYGLDLWKSQEADFGKKVLAGGERGNQ